MRTLHEINKKSRNEEVLIATIYAHISFVQTYPDTQIVVDGKSIIIDKYRCGAMDSHLKWWKSKGKPEVDLNKMNIVYK